jgi:hypothetical protein
MSDQPTRETLHAFFTKDYDTTDGPRCPLREAYLKSDVDTLVSSLQQEALKDRDYYQHVTELNLKLEARADAAEQARDEAMQGWAELGAFFKTGGMSDPAFLIGMVQAQVADLDRLQADLAALQAEHDHVLEECRFQQRWRERVEAELAVLSPVAPQDEHMQKDDQSRVGPPVDCVAPIGSTADNSPDTVTAAERTEQP